MTITYLERGGYLTEGYALDPDSTQLRSGAMGFQFLAIRGRALGMSVLATIYSTTNLRILSQFASRGLTGSNWSSNSIASGDFVTNNLNTDIDEQVWRTVTGTVSSVILTCDTQVPQGVFVDTVNIRGHNLTTTATVTMQGSNDPTFATSGLSVSLVVAADEIYWLSPEAPLAAYRYWRFTIDDPTQSTLDNYIEIGTILFGRSDTFIEESFVDEVRFSFRDFADVVQTEGFTNVSNSRSIKRSLSLDFRSLQFSGSNFKILRKIFTTYRTTHKCLWIPTPDPDDSESTSRFAVFGKLTEIPAETHNWKGSNADYVGVTVNIDESR